MKIGNLIACPENGIYLIIDHAVTHTGVLCYRFIGTSRLGVLFRGKLSVQYLETHFKVIS